MFSRQVRKKRWYLLYIARFPEQNPAIFGDKVHGANREGTCILSCDDPKFHRTFATTETARTFIRKKAEEAVTGGYSSLCIIREVLPLVSHRSSQSLVGDMADLEPLFREGSLILVCM